MTPSAPDLLVVGGTGFLGRHLLAAVPGRLAATHHRSAPRSTDVDWHRVDLADGGIAVAALIDRLRPSAVVNAAYVQGGADLDPITAAAPGRMAEAAHAIDARFIHLSTDVVFDGRTDRPYVETDPPSPVHDYGRAKAEAESVVAAASNAALIVRTSLLWGDRTDPGPQVLMTARADTWFFDDEFRNPIEVTVLAAALSELCAMPHVGGILHIGGADTVDRFEFARRVSPLVGIDPASLQGGPGSVATARPSNCPLDSSRAQGLLRTRLRGVRESTP